MCIFRNGAPNQLAPGHKVQFERAPGGHWLKIVSARDAISHEFLDKGRPILDNRRWQSEGPMVGVWARSTNNLVAPTFVGYGFDLQRSPPACFRSGFFGATPMGSSALDSGLRAGRALHIDNPELVGYR